MSGLLLTGCGSSDSTPATPAAPSPAPAPAPAPAPSPTSLVLTAAPARFLMGTSPTAVTVTGRLTTAAGAGLANQMVQFATTAGSLNTTLPMTAANGEATVTLTTSSSAIVQASAAGLNASASVEAVAPFTVRVEPKYSVVGLFEKDEVVVTVTLGTGFPNIPAPNKVVLDCGNGSTTTLGERLIASCTYNDKGVFKVTATATSDSGFTAVGTSTITIEARPITFTLIARRVGGDEAGFEIEWIVVGAPDKSVCTWDLVSTKRVGACNQAIVYGADETDSNGNLTITVTVDTKQGHDLQTLTLVYKLHP